MKRDKNGKELQCPQCGTSAPYRIERPSPGLEITCLSCGRSWFPYGGDPFKPAKKKTRRTGRARKAFGGGYAARRGAEGR